jgi:hypothetical protein
VTHAEDTVQRREWPLNRIDAWHSPDGVPIGRIRGLTHALPDEYRHADRARLPVS